MRTLGMTPTSHSRITIKEAKTTTTDTVISLNLHLDRSMKHNKYKEDRTTYKNPYYPKKPHYAYQSKISHLIPRIRSATFR